MELIRDLEQRFQNLDAALNSRAKVYAFYLNFNNNYNRINTRVFNESKEKKYKTGLNECRQEMLDQLIQIRNEQLNEVNEFMQNDHQNSLSQLKSLQKSIKKNYTAFAKGLATVYESILFRTKLANPLKFAQLVKYSKLMSKEEKVYLAKVKHLLNLPMRDWFVHVLPSNLILVHCFVKRYLLVLNKSGDLIRLKQLPNQCFYDVQVNATNIVAFDSINRNVEIYNFKLEQVHTIKFQREFFNFKLNN